MQFLCVQFNNLIALNNFDILIVVAVKTDLDYSAYFVSFETIIRYFLPDNLVIVQAINVAVLISTDIRTV